MQVQVQVQVQVRVRVRVQVRVRVASLAAGRSARSEFSAGCHIAAGHPVVLDVSSEHRIPTAEEETTR